MGFFQDITGQTGADAAKAAAADTYAKQQTAVNNLKDYGNTLPGQYSQIYQPYSAAGTNALGMLQSGLGLGGGPGSAAFTNAYRSLPGYQSALDTGLQSAERGYQAQGGLLNGGVLKALSRYGQNYEDQKSGDYLNRLSGIASGLGLPGAAGTASGIGANTGLQGQAYQGAYGSSGTIGQGDVAAAQSLQQGSSNLLRTGAALAGTALGGVGGFGALGGLAGGALGGLMGSGAGGPSAQQAYWGGGGYGPSQSNSFFSQA